MRYLGLTYKLGSDPSSGDATDCIRLVLRVLEDAGQNPPPLDRRWYRFLALKDYASIRDDWFSLTEQTHGPEEYALTLLGTDADFSIAIVVDEGLLTLKARVGVVWVPLKSVRPLNYRRLKHV